MADILHFNTVALLPSYLRKCNVNIRELIVLLGKSNSRQKFSILRKECWSWSGDPFLGGFDKFIKTPNENLITDIVEFLKIYLLILKIYSLFITVALTTSLHSGGTSLLRGEVVCQSVDDEVAP